MGTSNQQKPASMYLTAITLVEFRVWLLEGQIHLSAARFLPVALKEDGSINPDELSEDELRPLLPPFELEDTHTLLWVLVKSLPDSGEFSPEHIQKTFGFDEAGFRRLSVDLAGTEILLEEPLFPELADHIWSERYVSMHLRGGTALCEMLGVACPKQCEKWALGLRAALLESRKYDLHTPLPADLFSAMFCYERHVPVPPKVGAIVDLGIILKETALKSENIRDGDLFGLRDISRRVTERYASDALEALIHSMGLLTPLYYLDYLGATSISTVSVLFYLHWKYGCQKSGGLDLSIIRSSLDKMSESRFECALSTAVYLTGVYWGYQEIAIKYNAWKNEQSKFKGAAK